MNAMVRLISGRYNFSVEPVIHHLEFICTCICQKVCVPVIALADNKTEGID